MMTSSRVKRHVERDYNTVKVAGHSVQPDVCGFCGSDGGESGLANEIGFDTPNGVICVGCVLDTFDLEAAQDD